MHRVRAIVFFLCLATAALLNGAQEKPEWIVESQNEVEIDFNTGVATATNGVVVKYSDAVLIARKATFNQTTGDIEAEGDVRLEREGQVWIGEKLQYNFITRKFIATDFKTGQVPFFARGAVLVGDQTANVYAGARGEITTDDVAEPGYKVRAKSLVIVPGEYIIARHATLYLGRVPVFYFPYYRRNLNRHSNFFTFIPGYRSLDGPYLLTSYNWFWNERLDGALHLDGRQKRGVGVGPDFNWHLPRFGEGTFKFYRLHDDEPGLDPAGAPIREERQRIWFSQQTTLRSNLTARAVVRYQSDAQVIRDFFEGEYRKNVQPSSYLEINQQWPNFSLSVLAQPRINPFFETVERLPDVKLTGYRQQVGGTPFYYESESSAGWYRRKFASDLTNEFSALRADTYHQVTLPWTFFNWLNVTPRAGGRFTHYGESDGLTGPTRDQNREVFNTGAEVSFKASRLWPGVSSRFWELDGLRHIIEPSVNYVYVPRPNRTPPQLPPFDYELPTTRLLPIEFPDYNAIDSIDSQNVLRLSLRNRLQTKRKRGVENVVNWAVYTDWRLKPRAGQGTFSDLFSDLDLQPFSWLTLSSETRYDFDLRKWKEANHAATVSPNDVWSVTVGHRYLRDDIASGLGIGNNLIYSSVYYRFNENWGARASHHYEARDGVMEEQLYSLYRDFRSWTGALSLRLRESRVGRNDFTIALTFSLKAFPRFGLGEDSNKPSLLFGY